MDPDHERSLSIYVINQTHIKKTLESLNIKDFSVGKMSPKVLNKQYKKIATNI